MVGKYFSNFELGVICWQIRLLQLKWGLSLLVSMVSGYLGVPLSRITEIVREKRGVSADTAIRLAKFFGTTPEFWTNLQARHDFSKIQAEKKTELQRIPTCQEVGACMVS